MVSEFASLTLSPAVLEHRLERAFPDLLKFDSTEDVEESVVYQKVKTEVERILNAVVQENFAPEIFEKTETVRALAWNIERGNRFEGIVSALKKHEDLKNKDLLLLTELDYGMARSANRFVAQDLARELKLNYAFAPCYIALQKGSGIESDVAGENTKSLHGLAMFSKYPIKNAHAVPLPNGKDKMFGKEKRLGHLRALVADIQHAAGDFRAVTLHLDAHSSRWHRHLQMKIVLDHLETLPDLPTVIGGDWNTTTYNAQTANHAIAGYFRRVLMGVKNVVKNHYPFPDRYFERGLFQELEKRGFDYKNLNERGAGTLHYDVENAAYNTNLGDWVPQWCFPFIFWAARRVGGRVSARLDWFAGRGIKVREKPQTVGNLVDADNLPLSDHDAITLDFALN
ncbi:MAG: endonuclease/exonuclease/phosphatase family protein [Acidobacteria bacterium]|jgi:endonuclease/exonuclease/phosphatase family metal-dependent hydrolase|nr:endonuclease/exonuclease/phosphatase family protein [Acidobacteriota bacterium]MBA4184862.1 endonuclease/exonuclease/phosphatase family protein [Acidobacteriota bacterium]